MAEAAKAAGVKHTIWSSLDDTRKLIPLTDDRMPTLMGKYKVPHFDAKGESDQFFSGIPGTILYTVFYWDNFIYFGMGPQRGQDGKLANLFQFNRDFAEFYTKSRDISLTRALNPSLLSFEQWLEKYGHKISVQ
jgi:hypothetical protein